MKDILEKMEDILFDIVHYSFAVASCWGLIVGCFLAFVSASVLLISVILVGILAVYGFLFV